MSGRYNLIKEFIVKPVKNLVKSKKTSPTIVGTKPNVGNLKKNKEAIDKIIKTTDNYISATNDAKMPMARDLRRTGSKGVKNMVKTLKTAERNKRSQDMFEAAKGRKNLKTAERNKRSQDMFEAAKGRKNLKFGGGADMGSKKLSPKQMKIAKLAGNKKKIDKPDFKKLRAMKSPMDKTVRKA